MAETALELAADDGRHLYAPLVIMRTPKASRPRSDYDVAAVHAVVAQLEGAAHYGDRLPMNADYVLACGDHVQAFYLLDKPASVGAARPVAQELRRQAKCDPVTAELAHGWWVPGNLRWTSHGAEYQPVRVVKPWDGASRTSLAELRAALSMPKPQAPSPAYQAFQPTLKKPGDEPDEAELEADPWPKPLGSCAFHGLVDQV